VLLDKLSVSWDWRASVGLRRMDRGGWASCVGAVGLGGWSWVGEPLIRTILVLTGIPVATKTGAAGGLSEGGEGLLEQFEGSGGVLSWGEVVACVPRVTIAFVNLG
jgi:hypothetical protein